MRVDRESAARRQRPRERPPCPRGGGPALVGLLGRAPVHRPELGHVLLHEHLGLGAHRLRHHQLLHRAAVLQLFQHHEVGQLQPITHATCNYRYRPFVTARIQRRPPPSNILLTKSARKHRFCNHRKQRRLRRISWNSKREHKSLIRQSDLLTLCDL